MADDNEPLASSTGSLTENTAIDQFFRTMRALREQAGHGQPLTYRQLSQQTHFSAATLSKMLSGRELPTWPLAEAYIKACGANPDDLRDMWERARREAPSSRVDPPRPATVQTSGEAGSESLRAGTDDAKAWSFSVERLTGQYWVQLPTELFPRGPSRLVVLLGALASLGGATASIIAALRGQGFVPWPAVICAVGTVATGVGLWMLRERSLVLSAVSSLGDALSGVARVKDGVQLPADAQLDRIASSQALALRRSRDDAAADSLIASASRQPVR